MLSPKRSGGDGMSAPVRVVADDQEVVRAGFAALLDTQRDPGGNRGGP